MPSLNVQVKHAGKTHKLSLNTDAPPVAFKEAVYEVTGVPLDRMKVMVKGGILKVRFIISIRVPCVKKFYFRMTQIGVN